MCERCLINEMDAVHHLTYERKYCEIPEDLQAICNGCHEFIHAKSSYDPRSDAPVFIASEEIKSVYLAGKITNDNWRDQIVGGWSCEKVSRHYSQVVGSSLGREWGVARNAVKAAYGVKLDYTGPWWSDMGEFGGHGDSSSCSWPHAYGGGDVTAHGESCDYRSPEEVRATSRAVANNVVAAICKCDLLFAWINSDDCFGTIFEIGVAVSRNKTVVIACPAAFDHQQMWLSRSFSPVLVIADSAGGAWEKLWKHVEEQK
jgi:hypothetical protein